MSQLLTALVAAGLIDRSEDPDDRRRQALSLSTEGRRALRSAESLLARELGGLMADLPGPEVGALARVLPRLEAALGGTAPPRRPPPPAPRRRP